MALYVRNPWDSGSLVVADPFAAGELIITTATRGNLPYGPQYTHTMTVEDTVAGESATRTFSFLPPAGYEAGPVIPSTFLTTPDSIGSAFVGAVDEGDQLKLPNTYTSGGTPYAITWELDGSGNYTGRIASIDGPADQTLQGELWRLNGTPKWLQFNIDLDIAFPAIEGLNAVHKHAATLGTITDAATITGLDSVHPHASTLGSITVPEGITAPTSEHRHSATAGYLTVTGEITGRPATHRHAATLGSLTDNGIYGLIAVIKHSATPGSFEAIAPQYTRRLVRILN